MTRSTAAFDLTLVVHAASKAALLCSEAGEIDPSSGQPKAGKWLPRSEITLTEQMELKLLRWEDDRRRGTIVLTMTIPEWLAYDRGLM
jgi:hypothetical protein